MITPSRPPLSGQVVLAATVLLTSTSAAAFPSTVATVTSASPAPVASAILSVRSLGSSTTRVDPLDVVGDTLTSAAARGGLETLPERRVTSLAAARIVGREAALADLYKTLTSAVAARGLRVTQFVLAGEVLDDAPSEDVVLEIYVTGFDGEESRLDLWESLVELTATASFDAEFWDRFAFVVRRSRH